MITAKGRRGRTSFAIGTTLTRDVIIDDTDGVCQ